MSPEAISAGNEGYSFASDIWSFGCVMYEMCMLQSPFYQPNLNYYVLGKRIREAEFLPVAATFSEPVLCITVPHF